MVVAGWRFGIEAVKGGEGVLDAHRADLFEIESVPESLLERGLRAMSRSCEL